MKSLCILVAIIMAVSLAGCGNNPKVETKETEKVVEMQSTTENEAEEACMEEIVENVETESVESENVEETVEKLEGFQYQLTFDVDGTKKLIGFNTPEGYELASSEEHYYRFINAKDNYFSVAPFTLDGYSESALSAYEKYLSTGEWNGLYSEFMEEELLSERTVEVPGGTATIITGVENEMFKNQSIFVDFDGCVVGISMPQTFLATDDFAEEIVSGTEEEYIIDEILAQLFVETDNTEYLYPIAESTVEFDESEYEYPLTYFDVETGADTPFFGFNLPEGEYTQDENHLEHNITSYYEFTDQEGNILGITEPSEMINEYTCFGVYRHFLRTGEMETGVSDCFFEDGFMVMHKGDLVDMQLGETVETPYGTAYIVKALWQYDIFTEVSESALFMVNGKEVIITYHNRNAEEGTMLDSYESKLEGMLAEML